MSYWYSLVVFTPADGGKFGLTLHKGVNKADLPVIEVQLQGRVPPDAGDTLKWDARVPPSATKLFPTNGVEGRTMMVDEVVLSNPQLVSRADYPSPVTSEPYYCASGSMCIDFVSLYPDPPLKDLLRVDDDETKETVRKAPKPVPPADGMGGIHARKLWSLRTRLTSKLLAKRQRDKEKMKKEKKQPFNSAALKTHAA